MDNHHEQHFYKDTETFLRGFFLSFFIFFFFCCFYLFIFWLYWEAYGISVPKQGSNLYLLHWKWRVLTAGPPEVPKACFLCRSLRTIGVLKGLPWESKYLFKSLRSSLHHEAVIYSVSLCIRDFAKFWKYRYKREKKKKPALRVQGGKANIYTSIVKIPLATKNLLCLGNSGKPWKRNNLELTFEK